MSTPDPIRSPASDNFRAELERLGLTWTDAAKALDVDEKTVRRWAGVTPGATYNPRFDTLVRWGKLCDRSAIWFLESHVGEVVEDSEPRFGRRSTDRENRNPQAAA